jgi:hypothetical protein
MTGNTEAYVAELASSQIEAFVESAVVEIVGDDVTVAVGGLKSDVFTLAPTVDTVGKAADRMIYYPAKEGYS